MPLPTSRNLSQCSPLIFKCRVDQVAGWGQIKRALNQKELFGVIVVLGPMKSSYAGFGSQFPEGSLFSRQHMALMATSTGCRCLKQSPICLQILFCGHHPGQDSCHPTPGMTEMVFDLLCLAAGSPLLQTTRQNIAIECAYNGINIMVFLCSRVSQRLDLHDHSHFMCPANFLLDHKHAIKMWYIYSAFHPFPGHLVHLRQRQCDWLNCVPSKFIHQSPIPQDLRV